MPGVAIIGSGNVAFHLAKAFYQAGQPMVGLSVRDLKKAEEFKPFLAEEGQISSSPDLSGSDADLIIIAVSDKAISEVIKTYTFPPNAAFVHTSGSQSIDIFQESGIKNFGVFYPLQTFSKLKEIAYSDLKLFIEASNPKTEKRLLETGQIFTKHITTLNSENRLRLHLAAVIANNFSNYLFSVAKDQLKQTNLSFDLLAPLIQETIDKALTIGPENAQTGPAIRDDQEVIHKHLKLLEDQPEIYKVYNLLTNLIAQNLKT